MDFNKLFDNNISDKSSSFSNFKNKNDKKLNENVLKNTLESNGIYDSASIRSNKYSKFSRFGKILDPNDRLNNTREYLFFTKPDLHIAVPGSGDTGVVKINEQLAHNAYFRDLVELYPNVVKELQMSLLSTASQNDIFSKLLSFSVNSNLDLPEISAWSHDTPQTLFGTSIEYLGDGDTSDEKPSFSLEFIDTKELEVYHFFKAFQEYHKERKTGLVTPPSDLYRVNRQLHNVMGVYKFLVDEDMETIIHWSYFWGVYPTSVPREAFSSPEFNDGLTFSVNFKAQFVDDMDPTILLEFNNKMSMAKEGLIEYPIYNNYGIGLPGYINGRLPSAAYIIKTSKEEGRYNRSKYKLKWYGKP